MNNHANGFCLLPESGETIDANTTWSQTDTSYFVRNPVTVVLGKILSLSPGIVVKFDINRSLTINGKLLVQGTGPAPVVLTSYLDDEHGNGNNWDTNGNGASVCSPDEWEGILFGDTSDDTSLIDHALVRCAGNSYGGGAINLNHASPTVQNTTLTKNAFAGIATDTSTPVLGCNNIDANANYGLYNKTPNLVVNAENQWWGDPSGPHHGQNPSGRWQCSYSVRNTDPVMFRLR